MHHFKTVNVLKGSLLASYTWKFLRKQVIFWGGGGGGDFLTPEAHGDLLIKEYCIAFPLRE